MRKTIVAALVLLLLEGGVSPAEVVEKEPVDPQSLLEERERTTQEQKKELEIESWARALMSRNRELIYQDAAGIARSIHRLREEEGMDPYIVMAIILVESSAQQYAESEVGALGLMQIMPETGEYIARKRKHHWEGSESLLVDPDLNIDYGAWYYRYLTRMFPEDEVAALTAYNRGPGNTKVIIRKGRKMPDEYANKVLKTREELKAELEHVRS